MSPRLATKEHLALAAAKRANTLSQGRPIWNNDVLSASPLGKVFRNEHAGFVSAADAEVKTEERTGSTRATTPQREQATFDFTICTHY